jgi:hypothetical protein
MVVLDGQLDLGDRVVGPGRTFTFLVRRECAIRPPLTVRAYLSSSSTGHSTSRSSTEVPTGPLSATQPWAGSGRALCVRISDDSRRATGWPG